MDLRKYIISAYLSWARKKIMARVGSPAPFGAGGALNPNQTDLFFKAGAI
jgi:hypothetical protein